MDGSKSVFAILAFGELGESSRISLDSILKIHDSTICVAGDSLGLTWVRKNLSASQTRQLCTHQIPEKDLLELNLLPTRYSTYSNFGQERFIKLTTFKWFLISDILQRHPNLDYVIFSDLDVLWNNSIEDSLEFYFSNSRVNVAGQLDWNTESVEIKKYLCPGIMIWKNSDSSISMVEDIRGFHETKLLDDKNFPDDKAINSWMQIDKNHEKITFLSPNDFIIGHRLIALLAETSNFRLKNFKAFHANYCVGEVRKRFRIKMLNSVLKFPNLRFFVAGLILADIAIVKLRQTSPRMFNH